MILLNRDQPDLSLYVIGAFVIEKLHNTTGTFSILDLFDEVKEKIGFPSFLLTLDWLYIIGIIDFSDDGRLKICF